MGALGSMKMAGNTRNVQTENGDLKPLVVAIETSSRVGSVALAAGHDLLGQATFSAPLRHSAELFPAIVRLLSQSGYGPSDLDQVHISVGPGSFTGLRIAVAAAKAMHLANGVRIVTVDSLDAIAANVTDASPGKAFQDIAGESAAQRHLATVLDAKRGQFCTTVYEWIPGNQGPRPAPETSDADYGIPAPAGGLWHKVLPDCLMSATDLCDRFANTDNPILMTGDGLLYHHDRFAVEGVRILDPIFWTPQAAGIHLLGRQKASRDRFADPLSLVPFYLRGPEVTLRKRT